MTRAHKVTKPVIWLGISLAVGGGAISYRTAGGGGIFYRNVGFTAVMARNAREARLCASGPR